MNKGLIRVFILVFFLASSGLTFLFADTAGYVGYADDKTQFLLGQEGDTMAICYLNFGWYGMLLLESETKGYWYKTDLYYNIIDQGTISINLLQNGFKATYYDQSGNYLGVWDVTFSRTFTFNDGYLWKEIYEGIIEANG